jgi:hypothetical protein
MFFDLFGKGRIDLTMEKTHFSPGETIRGTASLVLKKPVNARQLRITFYGERSVRERSIDSKGRPVTRTKKETAYSFTLPLDGEKTYSKSEYPFEIQIPSDLLQQPQMGGVLGTALKAVQFLVGESSRVSWYVKATLDIPKASDINRSIQVHITPPIGPSAMGI